MTHAPGFGSAANDDKTNLMSNQLGFQMGVRGFAFSNLRHVLDFTEFTQADMFLISTDEEADKTEFTLALDEVDGIRAYSVETFNLEERSPTSALNVFTWRAFRILSLTWS